MTLLSNENSPTSFTITTSSNDVERRPFSEMDFNISDSGYNAVNESRKFKFTEPSGIAPKRNDSPKAYIERKTPRKSESCFRPLNSVGSDSLDSNDDCLELMDMDSIDRDAMTPTNFDSVVTGEMAIKRTPMRRVISMDDSFTIGRRLRNCISNDEMDGFMPLDEKSPFTVRCFKRTEKPLSSPINSKRWKPETEGKENMGQVRHALQKSVSMNDASQHIMNALNKGMG